MIRSFLTAYRHARRAPRRFTNRAQLHAWQTAEIHAHLARILPHSPFYRAHLGPLRPDTDWRTLPRIDKQTMMDNFSDLNTAGIDRDTAMRVALNAETDRDFAPTVHDRHGRAITVGLSSGTSGNRGPFLVSPAERAGWAGVVLGKLLDRPLWHLPFRPQHVAFFLRANSNLYTTLGRGPLRFVFHDLLDPLDSHITRLNRDQPSYLVAPPSMLRFLAEAQTAGQLTISPHKIISVAEVLDPLDEQTIAAAFNRPIHQVYQCTEGLLASTCAHGTLHLHEAFVAIQPDWLDEAHTKFAPIITDFNRVTQPIIRYRLDDVLTVRAEPCPCGSIMRPIAHIAGRCDDLFLLPPRDPSHPQPIPVFADYVRRAIITASDKITAYTAVQTAPDRVEIHLAVPDADRAHAETAVAHNLRRLWSRCGGMAPQITFAPLHSERPSHHKRKRVARTFAEDEI